MPSPVVTRFAPSPTGNLHEGHAYSALRAWQFAQNKGGRFLLRIEDIDFNRCSQEHTEQIFEDLTWLGIEWEKPVRIQSEHRDDYHQIANQLIDRDLLYPCFCTRREIIEEVQRAGQAPHADEHSLYPGTCRRLSAAERDARLRAGVPHALRLDLSRAINELVEPITWHDSIKGEQMVHPEQLGDMVLVRKDIGTSYHLSVVVDDGLQGVTDIIRGTDLFDSTPLQVIIQQLLGLPVPQYHHHPLRTDAAGKRLAKRDQSITLKKIRESGISAEALRKKLLS